MISRRLLAASRVRWLSQSVTSSIITRNKDDRTGGAPEEKALLRPSFKLAVKGSEGTVGGKYKNRTISDIWDDLKQKHPGCLLMIQIGDFYEMLNEDAREASRVLDIVLTKRRVRKRFNVDVERQVDMAGIPCRSLQRHLPKLTRAGIKVIVVQQQAPEGGKREWGKSMNREVTRIVTPGTLYEDELLSPGENNYLAAIIASNWSPQDDKSTVGLAWADVSTGELWAQSVSVNSLREQLGRINAKELLLPEDVDRYRPSSLLWLFASDPLTAPIDSGGPVLTIVENSFFGDAEASKLREKKVSEESMSSLERRAVNCLMRYVNSTLKPNFEWARPRSANRKVLIMDSGTRQALEVTKSQATKSMSGSLLREVDFTVTAGGARVLRSRLETPLTDVEEIQRRLDAVQFFFDRPEETLQIRRALRALHDPTRAFQRLRVGRWTLRDIVDVFSALEVARTIADEALSSNSSSTLVNECATTLSGARVHSKLQNEGLTMVEKALSRAKDKVFDEVSRSRSTISTMSELHNELHRALYSVKHYALLTSKGTIQKDEFEEDDEEEVLPVKGRGKKGGDEFIIEDGEEIDDGSETPNPVSSTGRLFKPGFSDLYDTLFEETNGLNSKRVEALQRTYQAEHDAKIRIVRSGTGQGTRSNMMAANYVVEVPKAVKLDPAIFSPVQSLKQRTRYTTAELNVLNGESLNSRDSLNEVERCITDFLSGHCLALALELENVFDSISQIDVACSSAHAARERNLVRPSISVGPELDVKEGRHLVVERNNANFISNNVHLAAGGDPSLWLITGPNMGGKSTFLRSTASIAILGQAGLFVPAKSALIGVVDRIFARIGASDDISHNRSTFMVEMEETAQFLAQATRDSLVIVDELGRGTSPQEGFAIAQAAMEALIKIGSRSLFATHFHRLANVKGGPCELTPTRVSRYTTEVVVVEEKGSEQIVFTYRMKPGFASSSFGLNVARMAGVPSNVLARAEQLLAMYQKRGEDL